MRSDKKYFFFLWLLPLSLSWTGQAYAQNAVFLKPAEAIKLMFQGSEEVEREIHQVSPEIREAAKKQLGYDLPKEQYAFYIGKTKGHIDGYAVIDEQVGKVLPITFITRINPEGRVDQVEIMVYRESHGGEIKQKRFLKQFSDKNLNSELRLHGDIVNITGATLSSRALVVGVKRALVLWSLYYGTHQTPPIEPGNQMGHQPLSTP